MALPLLLVAWPEDSEHRVGPPRSGDLGHLQEAWEEWVGLGRCLLLAATHSR